MFTKLHRVIRASFRIVWFASWQNTNTCSNILCWNTVSAPHYESTATLESAHNASIIIASLRFKSPTSKFNKPFKTNTLVNDDYPQVQKFASIPSTSNVLQYLSLDATQSVLWVFSPKQKVLVFHQLLTSWSHWERVSNLWRSLESVLERLYLPQRH